MIFSNWKLSKFLKGFQTLCVFRPQPGTFNTGFLKSCEKILKKWFFQIGQYYFCKISENSKTIPTSCVFIAKTRENLTQGFYNILEINAKIKHFSIVLRLCKFSKIHWCQGIVPASGLPTRPTSLKCCPQHWNHISYH